MDRLETIRVFIAVAETAGFASAARNLGLSAPAVTRAVAAVEERLGVRLFQRNTRQVRLTEAGERFLKDAKRILGELEDAEASAAGSHGEPRGALAVTASVMFGRMFVAPVLMDFLDSHAAVTARLVLLDRVVNLIEEGFDVAVRIAHLEDSSLSAQRIGVVRRVVVASPDYLARHGTPQLPADLRRHRAVLSSQVGAAESWSFPAAGGGTDVIDVPSQLVANSAEVAIQAAIAGRGLTRVLSYMVAPAVRAGQLRVVLDQYEPPSIPIHLVHAEGRRANAKIRAFVDFAAARLRADAVLQ